MDNLAKDLRCPVCGSNKINYSGMSTSVGIFCTGKKISNDEVLTELFCCGSSIHPLININETIPPIIINTHSVKIDLGSQQVVSASFVTHSMD